MKKKTEDEYRMTKPNSNVDVAYYGIPSRVGT